MKMDKMRKAMLLMFTIIALSVGTISCDDDDDDDNNNSVTRDYSLSGNANGTQMVPAVDSVTGTGTITGTYNPDNRKLTYTTGWNNLTSAPTGGGFYSGATGMNGSIVGAPWAFDTNATETGTRSGSMTLTEAQEDQLLNGDLYYVYTTEDHAAGEIRGQITATQNE